MNVVNMLFFYLNCRKVKLGSHAWWMIFLYFFGCGVVCALVAILLEYVFLPDSLIITIYNMYLVPVVISQGLIKYQEKYLNG